MNKKLDRIDEQIKEVLAKIETVHIINNYKSKTEEIINLKNAYKRFTSNPNKRTSDDFKLECVGNKMMKFSNWIEREVNAEIHLPLQKVIIEGYDMANLGYWSNQIAALLTNAMFLHSTCLGISDDYDEDIIIKTIYGTNGENGDIHEFNRVLRNIKKGFNYSKKEIKRLFFQQAKKDVESFMRKNEGMDHIEFTSKLRNLLTSKYDWRYWIVSSWNDNTRGFHKHSISHYDQNSWYWHHQHNRNLLVGSMLPDYKSKLGEQVENCRLKTLEVAIPPRQAADSINKYLQSCITTNWDSIAVVMFGNGLRVKFNNIVVTFENGTTSVHKSGLYQSGGYWGCPLAIGYCHGSRQYYAKFNVIVVPKDMTVRITTSEVCPGNEYCTSDYHCCQKTDKQNFYCCPDTTNCGLNNDCF
jgi:hypothetical protein